MRVLIAEDDLPSRRVLEATLVKWGHEVAVASPTYIILLTAKTEMQDVVAGLGAGADDYLTKPFARAELRARIEVGARVIKLQKGLLDRVEELNQALTERERATESMRNLSLTDELTGLYNRRGFLALAEQRLRTARRTGQVFSLPYADMDGLKQINDTYGHQEGSQALQQLAEILRSNFRGSDIVARLGDDEFAILMVDTSPSGVKTSLARLQELLLSYNTREVHGRRLSLSVGAVCINPAEGSSVTELLSRADQAMYENKRRKHRPALLTGAYREEHLALVG